MFSPFAGTSAALDDFRNWIGAAAGVQSTTVDASAS
jgi:hypothetical protein